MFHVKQGEPEPGSHETTAADEDAPCITEAMHGAVPSRGSTPVQEVRARSSMRARKGASSLSIVSTF